MTASGGSRAGQNGGYRPTRHLGGTISDDLRERRRRDSRAATVEAAFALFARRGYDDVTVADICEAADIGRRTFFRYFATKDDVLTEPIREMGDRVAAVFDAAPPELSDAELLRAAMGTVADYVVADRERMRAMTRVVGSSSTLSWSPSSRLAGQERQLAERLTARHGRRGRPDRTTRLLVGHAVVAFRVWLDDVVEGVPGGSRRQLEVVFDLDPLLRIERKPGRSH